MFVMWDFFPVHHAEIGRVPSGLPEAALKAAERATIDACDVVAVMSPRNADFLRTYHGGLTARTVILPPWAADAPDSPPVPKRDVFTVVFGGQLTRGVEDLIEAARLLEDEGVAATIEVYGWGPHRDDLVALAAERRAGLLSFHDPLPRDDYRRMLRSVHAGVAVTVPDVSVPTFPSKIVDYAQSSIAIIACLEEATDVGRLVVDSGAGVTCTAGDPRSLAAAIRDLARGEASDGAATAMGRNARVLFEAELSSEAAARTVLTVALGERDAAAVEGDQS
jgi:glycosyltransferase involved in cell wall biosynthesis